MTSVSLQDLGADWLNLTRDYRPSAFWFWNGRLGPELIEQSLEEMARAGVREVLFDEARVARLSEQYADVMPLGAQEVQDVAPDESAGAGEKYLHTLSGIYKYLRPVI